MRKHDDDENRETPPDDAESRAGLERLLETFGPELAEAGDQAVAPGASLAAFTAAGGPQDDVARAAELAARLFTGESAAAHFPPDVRERLGDPREWLFCLPYVRCCWMFGWLVCRGCRDYRALNYYLHSYWRCVRAVLGRGDADPRDFERLSRLLGDTYARWLRDELAQVELGQGPDPDVLAGRLDCCRKNAFTASLFEGLATQEAAAALLGREALAQHSRNPYFWLCRCWCQAALRLGCCMACARTREELERCWAEYHDAIRRCTEPLKCENIGPTGCVPDEPILDIKSLGVAVTGSVYGAFFGGYTIEWRRVEGAECEENSGWHSTHVHYPGGGSMGTAPVVNGVLGWIDTLTFSARSYEVRVCPRSLRPREEVRCCCVIFNLFKRFVRITQVGAALVGDGGPYDPRAPLVYAVPPSPTPHLVPVGCCLTIRGSAWVGECNDRQIRCFSLKYAPGCLPGPMETGFDPGAYQPLPGLAPLCYEPPDEDEKRAQEFQLTPYDSALTVTWEQATEDLSTWFGLPPGTIVRKFWRLREHCWNSTSLPACLDAKHGCASGAYTLLLDVEDTQGDHYYDTQCCVFDNKTLHVAFGGLEGLEPCQEMSLKRFVRDRPCGVAWPIAAFGTVYDEYIDPADHSYPSDNFDFYTLSITRGCGGPTYQVPITPDLATFYKDIVTGTVNPLRGTAHVGLPASADMCPCPPQGPHVAQHGVLTLIDLRVFDAVCAAQLKAPFAPPPGFALERGDCCGYVLQLYARDKTVDNVGPGHCHEKWGPPCAVCVCNDLPRERENDVGGAVEIAPGARLDRLAAG
jgi:hypothetical protein